MNEKPDIYLNSVDGAPSSGISSPSRDVRIFLCYRRNDGAWHAEWLNEHLSDTEFTDPAGNRRRIRIYYDKMAPGVADWKSLHFPSLQASQALVLICTPGIAKDFSKRDHPDWVYEELRWWIQYRSVSPIVIDATGEGDRWLPEIISRKWPNINRIDLTKGEVETALALGNSAFADRIRERVNGAILESEHATVFEDLERSKMLTRRLSWAVVIAAVLLVVTSALLAFSGVQRQRNVRLTSTLQRELNRANQSLAESILADLDLGSDQALSPRQRNALWKLAAGDEAVKRKFASTLLASPVDMRRITGGFGEVSRSLGLQWPSPAEAEKLFPIAVDEAATANRPSNDIFVKLQAVAARLTEVQAQLAVVPLLQQIGETTEYNHLWPLAGGLQALAPKLTPEQAQQGFAMLLEQIGKTTDPSALKVLAGGLQALAPKVTPEQAEQALATLLEQIGKNTYIYDFPELAAGLQTLAAKVTEEQTEQALTTLLLQQVDQTTTFGKLPMLGRGLQALSPKLTEAQAQQGLATLLEQIGKTTDPSALLALAAGLQALAPKLSEEQAQLALTVLLEQIGKTTDSDALWALAAGLQALAPKLSEEQAQQALAPLLEQIGKRPGLYALQALAPALQALPTKLSDEQAQQALTALLQQIQQMGTTSDYERLELALALMALAAKLSEEQAQQVLPTLLQQVDHTSTFYKLEKLEVLAAGLQALPGKLTEAQAQQALAPLLQEIGESHTSSALLTLAAALQRIALKVTEVQAQQALVPLLQQIGKTTDPHVLQALAEGLQALPAKLTKAQAQQALAAVLQQIGKTNGPDDLQPLAAALQALAGKLPEAQAQQALIVAKSSVAWAAREEGAAAWARVLVALLPHSADSDGTEDIIGAITYPSAAGPATGVLLDALGARHSDAPAKEAGTEAGLSWLARKFPEALRPPICPPPPQPTSLSGLKCPTVEGEFSERAGEDEGRRRAH